MAQILVLFGTTDGQTDKIARALADRFCLNGHHATAVNAAFADPDPRTYDAVVVAASVHAGSYQGEVVRWVSAHAATLNQKPTAFISVCLGVLQMQERVRRDLQTIIDAFLKTTSWRPLTTTMVAGALKYTHYNLVLRWLMKRIARKAGGATDTSRDYEYTDWAALDRFADAFGQRLTSAEGVQPMEWAC